MSPIKPEDLKKIQTSEEIDNSKIDYLQLTESSLKTIDEIHKLFPHWTRDNVIKKMQNTTKNKDLRFIAKHNGKIIAHMKFDLGKSIHDHVATATSLIVNQENRRKGIGLGLMEYSISKLPKKIKLITLTVDNKNKKAINLYKKIGFEKYGLLKEGSKINGEFVDNYLMFKKIN